MIIAVCLVLGEFLAAYSENVAFVWIAGILVPAVFLTGGRLLSGISLLLRGNPLYRGHPLIRMRAVCRVSLLLSAAGLLGSILYLRADAPDALLLRFRPEKEAPYVTAEGRAERIQERESGVWVYLSDAYVTWEDIQYGGQGIIWICSELPAVRIGSRVCLKGKLDQFSTASNPGQFDMYHYYRALGYGYTVRTDEFTVADARCDPVGQFLFEARRKLSANISRAAGGMDAGIMKAVFLGETQAVDKEIRDLYAEQGIAHLLSVSGLHISMIGMLVYRLLRRTTGSYGAAGIMGGIAVAAYVCMTGSTVSGQRALIMYLLSAFAAWRGRIYDTQTALAAAAAVIAYRRPLVVMQSPFLLSFGAVLGMSTIADGWKAFLLREDKPGLLSIAGLQCGMLPVLLYFYYQYPLYSVFLNHLVLPFGGLLIASAAGCACLGPFAKPAAAAGHVLLRYYELLCQSFARIPGSIRVNGRPSAWRLGLYLAVSVIFLAAASRYRELKKWSLSAETEAPGWKRRAAAVHALAFLSCCLAGLFLRADCPDGLEVTMLDVGQGDCCLIRLEGGINLLSDGGSLSQKNLAEYTLEPALLSKGIDCLDGVLLSHADQDHVNGVAGLLERGKIAVKTLILPDYEKSAEDFAPLLAAAGQAGCSLRFWKRGDGLAVGSAGLLCLRPEEGKSYGETNSASLVYTLAYGSFRMLFTGDIGTEEETGIAVDTDVLKVPHHGSRYSSSAGWLEELSPAAAFISCSAANNYGHPHPEVLERLSAVGADIYLTPKAGAITLTTDGTEFSVQTYKKLSVPPNVWDVAE